VVAARGTFGPDDAVELAEAGGKVFAKGLVRYTAAGVRGVMGMHTADLPDGSPLEVVHRKDLVFLP
jgi:glutamate 5-kinase